MAKQISVKNKDDHIDPRERILRHAKESEENPYWIDPCYKKTQPKPIFRETDEDEPPEKLTKTETFGWNTENNLNSRNFQNSDFYFSWKTLMWFFHSIWEENESLQ